MPEEVAITKRQRDILEHALGLDNAESPYRNHYCAGEGHINFNECRKLESLGLMVSRGTDLSPDVTFMVTKAGKAEVGWPEEEYEIRWDEEKTCGGATLEDGIYIAMIRFVGDGRCRYEVVLSTPAADSERQNFSHTSFSVRMDAQGRETNLQEMLDLIVRCVRTVKSKGEN